MSALSCHGYHLIVAVKSASLRFRLRRKPRSLPLLLLSPQRLNGGFAGALWICLFLPAFHPRAQGLEHSLQPLVAPVDVPQAGQDGGSLRPQGGHG